MVEPAVAEPPGSETEEEGSVYVETVEEEPSVYVELDDGSSTYIDPEGDEAPEWVEDVEDVEDEAPVFGPDAGDPDESIPEFLRQLSSEV